MEQKITKRRKNVTDRQRRGPENIDLMQFYIALFTLEAPSGTFWLPVENMEEKIMQTTPSEIFA